VGEILESHRQRCRQVIPLAQDVGLAATHERMKPFVTELVGEDRCLAKSLAGLVVSTGEGQVRGHRRQRPHQIRRRADRRRMFERLGLALERRFVFREHVVDARESRQGAQPYRRRSIRGRLQRPHDERQPLGRPVECPAASHRAGQAEASNVGILLLNRRDEGIQQRRVLGRHAFAQDLDVASPLVVGLGELDGPVEEPATRGGQLVRCLELLLRIRPNGLEQPIASDVAPHLGHDEALVDQPK
jgi:hypothetical protein